MKPLSKTIIALVAITGLAAGLSACGHHYRADPEQRAEHMMQKISHELELNDAQLAQLSKLKTALLDARKQLHEQRKSEQDTLQSLLSQPTLDRDRLLSLAQEHLQKMQQQAPQIVTAAGDFYDSLKPEQQHKLREEITERLAHSPWGRDGH